MKKLELYQMENLEGGSGGFGTAASCTFLAFALGAVITGATLGTGVFAAACIGAAVCGGSVGRGAASGSWF